MLGRAVQQTPDGVWTIADARAPGCEVQVHRTEARFNTTRRVDVRDLTEVAAGFGRMIGLEARFGRVHQAQIAIENEEILSADLDGPCGDVVVGRVFVGTGKRSLLASTVVGGGVGLGAVGPSASTEASTTVVDSTSWSDPQAYGFEPKKAGTSESLQLHAELPSVVHEGDEVSIRFESNQRAYLVVYYLDASGKGEVLWPSNEEPAPVVEPDRPVVLPSDKERAAGFAIQAALLEPGKPSRELLVAYAFSDKADFDRLRPEVGGNASDGAAYAAELTRKLQDIPIRRWSRAVIGYVIMPKGG